MLESAFQKILIEEFPKLRGHLDPDDLENLVEIDTLNAEEAIYDVYLDKHKLGEVLSNLNISVDLDYDVVKSLFVKVGKEVGADIESFTWDTSKRHLSTAYIVFPREN